MFIMLLVLNVNFSHMYQTSLLVSIEAIGSFIIILNSFFIFCHVFVVNSRDTLYVHSFK